MTADADRYDEGIQITFEVLRRFKIFGTEPAEFWLLDRGIVLLADVGDVRDCIARNAVAKGLIDEMCAECVRQGLGENRPTILMLQGVLDYLGIAYEVVPLAELGLPPHMILPRGSRGDA